MTSRLRQIFAATEPTDVEAAARRQQLAEAMQARALQPQVQDYRYYTPAAALTDLGSALVSAYNVKRANQAYQRAKDAQSQRTSEALQRYAASVPDDQVGAEALSRIKASAPDELPEPVEKRSAAYGGLIDTMTPESKQQMVDALVAQQVTPNRTSSPYGAVQPDKFTPESLAVFEKTGKYSDLRLRNLGTQFGRYNPGDFTPESWAQFVASGDPSGLVRYVAPQNATVEDFRGGKAVIQPSKTGGPDRVTVLSTQQEETDASANRKKAEAAAAESGKIEANTATTAQFDLPRVEDNAAQTLKLLDRLEKHPGRELATGASAMIPVDKLSGTDARDFVTLLGSLRGKQFLEAFNMLKGAGQITEVEGSKAESAISTIQDRGQSEKSYLQAIQDLRDVVNSGVKRARQKAAGLQKPSAAPSQPANSPAVGTVEDGYRFKGGDPSDSKNWIPVQ